MTTTVLIIMLATTTTITTSHAQQFPLLEPDINAQTGIFQNTVDGIRFKVPSGWVVEDIDNLNSAMVHSQFETGFLILAKACPEQEALPGIGGLYNCEQAKNQVQVMRYSHLEDRPQFAVIENPLDITPNDFVAYLIGDFQGRGYTNIQIANSTDTTVNVTSEENPDMVIKTMPAKFVEITYQPGVSLPELRMYAVLVTYPEELNPGTSQIVSGEFIGYQAPAATTATIPPAVQEILDTYGIIR
jgi:hypothetical protein